MPPINNIYDLHEHRYISAARGFALDPVGGEICGPSNKRKSLIIGSVNQGTQIAVHPKEAGGTVAFFINPAQPPLVITYHDWGSIVCQPWDYITIAGAGSGFMVIEVLID